jgi:hypothetical protein
MTSSALRRTEKIAQVTLAAAILLAAVASLAQDDIVERGKYLLFAGGCISCHTEDVDDAVPLAGGRAMESPFGTFYSPNITPDPETGIGNWSDDDFVNAFWEGISPRGEHYFPAFPYTSYTGVSRDDLLAMKAHLFSLESVRKKKQETRPCLVHVDASGRGGMERTQFQWRTIRSRSDTGRHMEQGRLSRTAPRALR